MFVFPEDVRGYLTEREGTMLYELAHGKTVIEVGTFCGRSAICIAQSATRLHVVDTFLGDGGVGRGLHLAIFLSNLARAGLRERVCCHVGDSRIVMPMFSSRAAEMVFIDGGHEFEIVSLDLQEAIRVLGGRGCLALHDYNLPGVRRALDEVGLFTPREQVDSLVTFDLAMYV